MHDHVLHPFSLPGMAEMRCLAHLLLIENVTKKD